MASKCANPECSIPFFPLGEGKLFQFLQERERNRPDASGSPRTLEHFWLCGQCAVTLRLLLENQDGAVVPRLVPMGSGDLPTPSIKLETTAGPAVVDERDPLELLKLELNFLNAGGYGRSVRLPQRPTSIFRDSLTCINFGDPNRTHPCEECALIQFVPPERRQESVPCHHIRLNDRGETVDRLETRANQFLLEDAVAGWLRSTIWEIEQERARHPEWRKAG